jgi:hypothetical protein
MAVPGVAAARPKSVRPIEPWLRLALVVVWAFLAVAAAVIGERSAKFGQLEHAIATGRVHNVSVSGEGLGADGTGYATQEVHWRQGPWRRMAEVVVSSPGEDVSATDDDAEKIVSTDLGTYLSHRHDGLQVARTPEMHSWSELLVWRVPIWLGLLAIGIDVAALILLITGPEPWRATRWAWFWLWLTPVGAPAILLLSGATPVLPAPRDVNRRLTGAWALLIAIALHWLWPG